MPEYKREGTVTHVTDGDTIYVMCELTTDFGWHIYNNLKHRVIVRLARINAESLSDPDPIRKDRAAEARQWMLVNLLNKKVYISSKKLDQWGRSISEVYLKPDYTDAVSDRLVKEGLADYVKGY